MKRLVFLVIIFALIYFVLVPSKPQSTITGIIIPHHDLAREYIIPPLENISRKFHYSTIVIIGPNHFQSDSTKFLSTINFFDYPIDQELVTKLVNSGYLTQDKAVCENDHSLGNPMLYLYQYFPNSKFVPILAPSNFSQDNIKNLAKQLTNIFPSDTLYVGSVDFSHGKTVLEAIDKNNQSEQAIKNFNYQQIYQYQDDHLDSPSSVGLLLNVMQNIGSTNWATWTSSHGSFIENNFNISATSYLVGVFN